MKHFLLLFGLLPTGACTLFAQQPRNASASAPVSVPTTIIHPVQADANAPAGAFQNAAQQPRQPAAQITEIPATGNGVPQLAVVPVQQPPVQVVSRTTIYENSDPSLGRSERRALRARNYAARLDSLVQSRNYLFFPATMQELPDGQLHNLYAGYLFLGIFADHVEVHLPVERGATQYVSMLNFDSMSIRNYQVARIQCGWTVSFDTADGEKPYHISLTLSLATGEAVLNLITPSVTMRYTGQLDVPR